MVTNVEEVRTLVRSGVVTRIRLAEMAGVSRDTLKRVLAGSSCNTGTLSRIFAAASQILDPTLRTPDPSPSDVVSVRYRLLPSVVTERMTRAELAELFEQGVEVLEVDGESVSEEPAPPESPAPESKRLMDLPAGVGCTVVVSDRERIPSPSFEPAIDSENPAKYSLLPSVEPKPPRADDPATITLEQLSRVDTCRALMKGPGSPIPKWEAGPGSRIVRLVRGGWRLLRVKFLSPQRELVEYSYAVSAEAVAVGGAR